MSEDCHDSNNASEPTESGNIFPACTPEQDKALARLRACSVVHVESPAEQESGNTQIPGYVIGDWAKIDAEIAELERMAKL